MHENVFVLQESEEKKERKERSPGGGVGRFVGWFRGRSARGGSSANGGTNTSHPGGASRPGSSPGMTGPAHTLSLSIGGSSSSGGVNGSSHGEPATEAERRMAAREISADNLSLPRAASLQLPAPVNCQVRHPLANDSHRAPTVTAACCFVFANHAYVCGFCFD